MSREYIVLNLGLWTCIQYTYIMSFHCSLSFYSWTSLISPFFFYINFVRYYILVLLCLVVLIIVPDSFNRRDWKNCNHRNLLIFLQLVSCVIFFIYYSMHFVSNLLMSQYHYFWGMSIALVHFQYLDRMKFLSTICIGTICVDSDYILVLPSYYISDSLHCLVPTQWNLYFAISL